MMPAAPESEVRPFLFQTETYLISSSSINHFLEWLILRKSFLLLKKSWSCTKIQLVITVLFYIGTFLKTCVIQSCTGHLLFKAAKNPLPLLLKWYPELTLGKLFLHYWMQPRNYQSRCPYFPWPRDGHAIQAIPIRSFPLLGIWSSCGMWEKVEKAVGVDQLHLAVTVHSFSFSQ